VIGVYHGIRIQRVGYKRDFAKENRQPGFWIVVLDYRAIAILVRNNGKRNCTIKDTRTGHNRISSEKTHGTVLRCYPVASGIPAAREGEPDLQSEAITLTNCMTDCVKRLVAEECRTGRNYFVRIDKHADVPDVKAAHAFALCFFHLE